MVLNTIYRNVQNKLVCLWNKNNGNKFPLVLMGGQISPSSMCRRGARSPYGAGKICINMFLFCDSTKFLEQVCLKLFVEFMRILLGNNIFCLDKLHSIIQSIIFWKIVINIDIKIFLLQPIHKNHYSPKIKKIRENYKISKKGWHQCL